MTRPRCWRGCPRILAAARRQFSTIGYDRTSLRQVALEAGVDPTLVSHFFGDTRQLFLEVVESPFDPSAVLPALLAGPRRELGMRLTQFVLTVLENPDGRARVLGLVRAANSEPEAARLIRDLLTKELLVPLAAAMGDGEAEYRTELHEAVAVIEGAYAWHLHRTTDGQVQNVNYPLARLARIRTAATDRVLSSRRPGHRSAASKDPSAGMRLPFAMTIVMVKTCR